MSPTVGLVMDSFRQPHHGNYFGEASLSFIEDIVLHKMPWFFGCHSLPSSFPLVLPESEGEICAVVLSFGVGNSTVSFLAFYFGLKFCNSI